MRSSDDSASDRAAVQRLITNILSDGTNTLLLFIHLFPCVSLERRVTPAHIPALVIGKKKITPLSWGGGSGEGGTEQAFSYEQKEDASQPDWTMTREADYQKPPLRKKRCMSGRVKALFSQRTSSSHALNSQLWRTTLLQERPFYEVNRNLAHNTYT